MDAAPKKYNTVYKITNNANKKKKIYIGVHITDDLNDSYLGSGTALDHAKRKYGKEKFTKEILSIHDTYEEALAEEARIVTKEFIERKDNYNMKTGGIGGLPSDETRAKQSASHKGKKLKPRSAEHRAKISAAKMGNTNMLGKTQSDETKAKMSAAAMGNTYSKGHVHSAEHRANSSAAAMGNTNCKGNVHSTETRAKISAALKGRTHSAEHKANMSAAAKNRVKKTCPHCGAIMDPCHYVRWHGDKCKQKPQ